MIDVRLLRADPDAVRTAMARRQDPSLLDQLDDAIRLDERIRTLTTERDERRARVNELSKEVGRLRRAGDVDAAEAHQEASRALGVASSGERVVSRT